MVNIVHSHYLVIIFRVRRPWSFIASFLILGLCVPGKIAMEKKVDAKNYDEYKYGHISIKIVLRSDKLASVEDISYRK